LKVASPFEAALEASVAQLECVGAGAAFDVALSGGRDSVALLLGLARLAPAYQWKLRAHHVAHGLRDDRGDEARCRSLCDQLGVDLLVSRFGPGEIAREPEDGTQAKARAARYRVLERAARDRGATCILTAHHGDDNVETLLLRLVRGAGLEGLGGIAPCLRLEAGLWLVRPLLAMGRPDIDQYLEERQVVAAEDPTNAGDDYLRNRVRHHVLPALNELRGPGGMRAARRSVSLLGRDAAALDELLEWLVASGLSTREPAWYLRTKALRSFGPAVVVQVLRHAARAVVPRHGLTCAAAERGFEVVSSNSRRASWEDGVVRIAIEGPFVCLRAAGAALPRWNSKALEVIEGVVSIGDPRAPLVVVDPAKVPLWASARRAPRQQAEIAAASIRGELELRPADEVETGLEPPKLGGHKRCVQVASELGAPGPWRGSHPVVVDSAGPLWVVGGPLDARAAADGGASVVLRAEVLPWYL